MDDNAVDWTPTHTSPFIAQLSCVLAARPDELRIEQRLSRILYYWMRLVALLIGIVPPSLVVLIDPPHGSGRLLTDLAIFVSVFVLLFTLPLYFLAELLDRRAARSCVFERDAGRFRRSKRDGTIESEVELERVHGVQFLAFGLPGKIGQINLVLDDGSRVHVYSGPHVRGRREDAAKLAEWLDKPLLEQKD